MNWEVKPDVGLLLSRLFLCSHCSIFLLPPTKTTTAAPTELPSGDASVVSHSLSFLLLSVQALPSPVCVQTLPESDPAQNAHQASLPSHGEIQH